MLLARRPITSYPTWGANPPQVKGTAIAPAPNFGATSGAVRAIPIITSYTGGSPGGIQKATIPVKGTAIVTPGLTGPLQYAGGSPGGVQTPFGPGGFRPPGGSTAPSGAPPSVTLPSASIPPATQPPMITLPIIGSLSEQWLLLAGVAIVVLVVMLND
jgi:hypothetical protein